MKKNIRKNIKQNSFILLLLLLSIVASSCGSKNAEFVETEEIKRQEREEVNAMQGAIVASDGNTIYMVGGNIIYRVDEEKKQLTVNCGDFMCDHESITCSARLPYRDNFYEIKRNGKHVYVLGDKIYEIGENSKKEIGHGNYGNYGNKIIFGDYIAFFEKEDAIVVKHIESDKEVQRFEGIRGYVQGSFYYKESLYYVTDVNQLVRLDIKTGDNEVLEKKGATRASVYDGFIYYIKVSEDTDTNCLVKMNPETLEKQELAQGVFYYNMHEDNLYYISYPEGQFYSMDLNGENRKEIPVGEERDMGWLWMFPQTENAILTGADCYTYYLFDMDSEKINYEEPVILPGSDGEVVLE